MMVHTVVIPCQCHRHHVKDVHPATRRCARRARLSFPKVPSFCSLKSPGHITHVNNVVSGEQDVGGAPSFDQLATDAVGVSSSERSKLGASTHLHQATGFVTTANLCLGHADILRNITVTRS